MNSRSVAITTTFLRTTTTNEVNEHMDAIKLRTFQSSPSPRNNRFDYKNGYHQKVTKTMANPFNLTVQDQKWTNRFRSSRVRGTKRLIGAIVGCVQGRGGGVGQHVVAETGRDLEKEERDVKELLEALRTSSTTEKEKIVIEKCCEEKEGGGGGPSIVELLECLEREAIMGQDQGRDPTDYYRRAHIFDKSSTVFQALKEQQQLEH